MDFSGDWSSMEAIFALYFYNDKSLRSNGTRRKSMETAIRHVFGGNPIGADGIAAHEIELVKKVESRLIKADGPKIDLSWPPVLWMRWAFEHANELPIASDTLRLFSNWRDNFPDTGTWRVVGRSKRKKNGFYGRKRSTPAFGHTRGFTLDEFLLAKKEDLVDDDDLYRVTWSLKRYDRIPQPEEKSRRAYRVRAYANEGLMVPRCGRNLLNAVREGVEEALQNAPSFLEKKRVNGRYRCRVSRAELAHWLHNRFSSLEDYKESNIVRALSTVVSCPRGNTKARMSIPKRR